LKGLPNPTLNRNVPSLGFGVFFVFFNKQNVCLCVYRKYKIATSKGHLKALTLIGTLNKMNTYFYQKLGI
jgi:hypothetical protein